MSQETGEPTATPEGTMSLEGTVRVDRDEADGTHRKRFLGALLEQDDGTTWVLTYRAESPFHELRDHRVRVEGTPYAPQHQALMARHLRVTSMKADPHESGVRVAQIFGEERLTGRFEEHTFPEGTKLAGERWIRFVDTGGTAFFLSHGDGRPLLGETVTVVAHREKPSPFLALPGGPYLWILDIERHAR